TCEPIRLPTGTERRPPRTRPTRSRLFSCALRQPPIASLVPYTTLFRSELLRVTATDGVLVFQVPSASKVERPRRLQRARNLEDEDRKSTRLNSSHGSISYAVFCLKKKNKVTATRTVTRYATERYHTTTD